MKILITGGSVGKAPMPHEVSTPWLKEHWC